MTVATFIAIKNAKQTRGAMAGAMGYVAKDEKTLWRGISLVAGHILRQEGHIPIERNHQRLQFVNDIKSMCPVRDPIQQFVRKFLRMIQAEVPMVIAGYLFQY